MNPSQIITSIMFFFFFIIVPIVGVKGVIRDVIKSREKGKQLDKEQKSEEMKIPPFE